MVQRASFHGAARVTRHHLIGLADSFSALATFQGDGTGLDASSYPGPSWVTIFIQPGSIRNRQFCNASFTSSGAFCPSSNSAVGVSGIGAAAEANVPTIAGGGGGGPYDAPTAKRYRRVQEQHSGREGVNSHITDMWARPETNAMQTWCHVRQESFRNVNEVLRTEYLSTSFR